MRRSLFLYPDALDRAREVLMLHVERGAALTAQSVEARYAVRLAARAARGDGLELDRVRDDLTRLAVALFGDGSPASAAAARIIADWAAEEYGHRPEPPPRPRA